MDNTNISQNIPISIDYYKGYGYPEQTSDLHFHTYNELSVVKSGGILYNSKNINFQTSNPCVIFSQEHTLHNSFIDPEKVYERYQLKFHTNIFEKSYADSASLSSALGASYIKELDKADFNELYTIIRSLYTLLQSNEESDFNSLHEFTQLLLLVIKSYSVEPPKAQKDNSYISDVMKYIKNNYASRLTIDDITSCFFVSRGKLIYDFKKYCGMNILEYITMIRVENAKEYLLQGLSVASVAEKCGFCSSSYFIKVFSEVTNYTPLKFQYKWSPEFTDL